MFIHNIHTCIIDIFINICVYSIHITHVCICVYVYVYVCVYMDSICASVFVYVYVIAELFRLRALW